MFEPLAIEKLFIKFYQITNLCPNLAIVKPLSFSSICSALLTCCFLLYAILIGVFHSNNSELNNWHELAKILSTLLTCITICIESFFRQRNHIKFWQIRHRVNKAIFKIIDQKLYVKVQRQYFYYYLRVFIGYQLIVWPLEIWKIIYIQQITYFYWYFKILPLMFTRLRYFQRYFYTHISTMQLYMIRKKLDQIVRCQKHSKGNEFCKSENVVLSELRTVKYIYSEIYQMTIYINQIFAISQLANIIENLLQLTTDLFAFYSKFSRNELENVSGICIDLLPTAIILLVVMDSCEQCLNEVSLVEI